MVGFYRDTGLLSPKLRSGGGIGKKGRRCGHASPPGMFSAWATVSGELLTLIPKFPPPDGPLSVCIACSLHAIIHT